MKLCASTTLLISQVILAVFLHETTGSFYIRFGRSMKKVASDARVMRARAFADSNTEWEQPPQISRITKADRLDAIDVPNDEHILSDKRKK